MPVYAINKQVFEVNCRSEEIAKTVQLEIEHFTSIQINSIINSVLNDIIESDTQLKIDKLEINLGDVSIGEFGEVEMLDNFTQIFREKVLEITTDENIGHHLVNGNSSSTALSRAKGNDWEMIQSYLLYGDLPWWTDKNIDVDINGTLQRLISQYPETIKTFLNDYKERLDVLRRLNDQLKPAVKAMIHSLIPGLVPESMNREIFRLDQSRYPEGLFFPGELMQKLNSLSEDFHTESVTQKRERLVLALGKIINLLKDKYMSSPAGVQYFDVFTGTLMKGSRGKSDKKTRDVLTRYIQRLTIFEIEFLLLQITLVTGSGQIQSIDVNSFDTTALTDSGWFIKGYQQPEVDVYGAVSRLSASGNNVVAKERPIDGRKSGPSLSSISEDRTLNRITGDANFENNTASPTEADRNITSSASEASPVFLNTLLTFDYGQNPGVNTATTVSDSSSKNKGSDDSDVPPFQGELKNQTRQQYPGKTETEPANLYFRQLEKEEGKEFTEEPGNDISSLDVNRHENEAAEKFLIGAKKGTAFFLNVVRILASLQRGKTKEADKNYQDKTENKKQEKLSETADSSVFHPGAETSQHNTGNFLSADQQENIVFPIKARSEFVTSKSDEIHLKGLYPVTDKTVAAKIQASHLTSDKENNAEINTPLPGKPISHADDISMSASQLKARKIAFITGKLNTQDPVLYYYLQQLDDTALDAVAKVIKEQAVAHTKKRKTIRAIAENPHFLQYDILKLYANIYFDKDRDIENAVDQSGIKLSKKRKALLAHFVEKIQISHTSFLLFVDTLSSKEILLLTEIFEKKRCDNLDESKIIRKVLYKLPEEAMFLIKFLTELSEKEIMELTSLNRNKLVPGFIPADKGVDDVSGGTIDVRRFGNELPGKDPVNKVASVELTNPLSEVFFKDNPAGKIYIENAGLCIIALYFRGLFNNLGYLEKGAFKNKAMSARAVFILQYLASGKKKHSEYLLQFNKALCGFRVNDYLGSGIRITKKEMEESDLLLQSVIENWKALKSTSLAGFRESFIQRKGILIENELNWTLQVERKGFDLLLNTIPWGFNIIKLPWMKKHIRVDW